MSNTNINKHLTFEEASTVREAIQSLPKEISSLVKKFPKWSAPQMLDKKTTFGMHFIV